MTRCQLCGQSWFQSYLDHGCQIRSKDEAKGHTVPKVPEHPELPDANKAMKAMKTMQKTWFQHHEGHEGHQDHEGQQGDQVQEDPRRPSEDKEVTANLLPLTSFGVKKKCAQILLPIS